ncbi:hypothetical protein [Tsuneonella sp. HG222]
MERSIDELLSGEPEAEVTEPQEVVTEEAPVTEAELTGEAAERPRDEHGRFAPKQTGEQQPETAEAAEVTPANPIPDDQFKGYLTEKRKRQELEQEIAALKAQFSQASQQRSEPEPPVDFWDNPTGVISAEAKRAAQLAIQEFQQQQVMERINASETAAKAKYADYGDAFGAFQQAASANPALIQQMTSAGDPAEFAYKTGKRAMELEQVGSLDALIAAERAKWEAEARAAIPAPAQTFPSTAATDGSVGVRSGPAWSGPKPINELLG